MKKIVTITLNPALDKSMAVPQMVPEKKLLSTNTKIEPGGGGINVSRAIHNLGGESEAIFLSGGYTGKQFETLLTAENISFVALSVQNDMRENFVVLDTSSHLQYRFGMQGARVAESEWQQVLQHIQNETAIDYIVASGSLPPGVPVDFFGRLAVIANQKNAKLVVDTSGEALQHAVNTGVYLIKPNLDELSYLYGKERLEETEVLIAAQSIIQKSGCKIMVVSMGAEGAMLITKDTHLQVKPPQVTIMSTVGAGDSMVGAMIYTLSQNWPLADVLRYGIAAGTAATMNAGTELCKKEDTERIFKELKQE